jgi:CHAT domain-containing protein
VKSVLLEFLSTNEKTIIFVIRQDWEEKGIKDSEPLVFEADFNEKDVTQCVKEIRSLYSKWEEHNYQHNYLDNIQLEDRTSFYKIGEKIFSDELISAIKDYDLIYFVPFSSLHHLPLHAMRYKDREIIDDFACSYLPSASVLQFVNKNKERPEEFNIKTIGVDFKGEWRGFAKEAKDIAKEHFFSNSKSYLKTMATKENFFKENNKFNILHCSSHGYFIEKNPLQSVILLYYNNISDIKTTEDLKEKLETPSILHKNSVITVNDLIERLNSSFELIFITACVTGENKNEVGDELIGLSRGLFYSGTKSMILTLFNILRNVTSDKEVHVKNFYKYWIKDKKTKSKAFQQYIQDIKAKERYSHPFYWFAFILIGNPY